MNKMMLYPLPPFLLAAPVFAADPFVGTWKLNVAKSKFGGPDKPREQLTIVIQEQGDQVVETVKGLPLTAPLFPANSFFQKQVAKLKLLAKRETDSHAWDWTIMRDGKVIRTEHDVVSDDGKTLTSTRTEAQGKPSETVMVFDRI